MEINLAILPGDGIGPEVVRAGILVLEAVSEKYGHTLLTVTCQIGGIAIDETGSALPEETLDACKSADAILLGAVGGPKWDDPSAQVRPEQGLLGLRKALDLYANLRPVRSLPGLLDVSPIRPERIAGVDMVVVRELTGGIYFGEPRRRQKIKNELQAVDTMVYSVSEIRRVAHLGFKLARVRRKKLTSIDKANVLECSRLWREVVTEVALEYPDVELEHNLVDAAAMYLINKPGEYDVILTANMFGDILTDEASMLAGSMGLLPSASLGETMNRLDYPLGLYEPIHGSAPDIAGRDIANPVGTMLSLGMLLRHSLGLENEAKDVERAVEESLESGARTADLTNSGEKALSTTEFAGVIIQSLNSR
jgi:3-isopropylmalate dehydrogenase